MVSVDTILVAATVVGALSLLANVASMIQTQYFMNAIESLRASVNDLQTVAALAVQAMQRPVVPADEVQALANAVANVTDSLRQNLPPLPPS
jgi:HAMP domain-containing protein